MYLTMEFLTPSFFLFLSSLLGYIYIKASVEFRELPHCMCPNCCNVEWLFIFRELESTGNYFLGAGEQVHSFGDLGSPVQK